MDLLIGLGIAVAGYCIGDGLKNFKNPTSPNLMDTLTTDDDNELIKESHLHYHMGISKEDAQALVREYPDVPHIVLNGKNYFLKAELNAWLGEIGRKKV